MAKYLQAELENLVVVKIAFHHPTDHLFADGADGAAVFLGHVREGVEGLAHRVVMSYEVCQVLRDCVDTLVYGDWP